MRLFLDTGDVNKSAGKSNLHIISNTDKVVMFTISTYVKSTKISTNKLSY